MLFEPPDRRRYTCKERAGRADCRLERVTDQAAFKEMANFAGAHYYIVRSVGDVETLDL
jgi:hypothetical protein